MQHEPKQYFSDILLSPSDATRQGSTDVKLVIHYDIWSHNV